MGWRDGFIAVDWGTTNRRGYRLEADGRMSAEFEDDQGILKVGQGGFQAALAQVTERLGDHPLLLAGMIGSSRGWVEAPYAPCPAGLPELAGALKWVEPDRVAIVPGVSYLGEDRADVMRGEEVQILGAFGDGMVPADALICHPGTHNKWARLEDGRITSFRTVMTGELFSLLSRHSILADLLGGDAEPDEAFGRGVKHGLEQDDLTSELFAVRARVLLGQAARQDAASFTSGLLIGTDLRIGLRGAPAGEIVVMGRAELTGLFAAALRIAEREPREVDGEQAFLAGCRHLKELIR